MYLCIGIDCLDKTTLIGVRDVQPSLVPRMCVRREMQSRSTRNVSHEGRRIRRQSVPPMPQKNAHVVPILMAPSSFGF